MQFPTTILVVLALATFADAVGFLGPHRESLMATAQKHENKDMPTTKHNKTAGDDYNEGSPLFQRQEALKKGGKVAKLEKPASKDPLVADLLEPTIPPADTAVDYKHWWQLREKAVERKDFVKNGLTYFFSYFIIVLFIALVWIKCSYPPRSKESFSERQNNPLEFAYSIFSVDHCVGHHGSVCFCSWCCAPLRMADTYSKEPFPLINAGANSFWAALVLIAVLLGLNVLSAGWSVLVFLCLAVYFRQQIRRKYGIQRGGLTWCTDCFSWLFCGPCAIAQEARQVDFVRPLEK